MGKLYERIGMKIGIIGTRYLNNIQKEKVEQQVEQIIRSTRPEAVVTGDATGVDSVARSLGQKLSEVVVHTADWKKYGKSAGPRRNTLIVEDSDAIYAFWDGKSPGTKNCVTQARERGIPVTILDF